MQKVRCFLCQKVAKLSGDNEDTISVFEELLVYEEAFLTLQRWQGLVQKSGVLNHSDWV